ncbi:PulJ/GspJ family protein [Aureibacter tunicatorum]|uniref:Prepilin-type N-terminal cleavage/methylation domain-containing protein n=1 Tax=Aureibacter tunicatorum TaxID=866807 RepID=A0AAE3XSK1_9BACT|nr:prepilin-type N-terminal cleavage/methylation domain-containing protein [Aureibacter tunicatorum]MDR6241730.1 prepilin-type N-terminal cleavage/methylation domain-containing protein [Aureibacter tunicatorum]BDD07408.1 hypothetical protein AUTU_48910 [Aureibacter tunicatorum]
MKQAIEHILRILDKRPCKNIKLKAFTLQELMIAMILSAVVASASYQAVRYVQKMIHIRLVHSEENRECLHAISIMKKDILLSDSIQTSSEGFICFFPSHNIYYQMLGTELWRNNPFVHSKELVHSQVTDLSFGLNNHQIIMSGMLIDKVSLNLQAFQESLHFSQHKSYDLKTLKNHP